MLYALLAALVVVNITHLWAQDRQAKRAHEERQAHRLEIIGLVQRIQAPELAVVQHDTQAQTVMPPAVSPFDDNDFWKAQNETEEALQEIARMERDGL